MSFVSFLVVLFVLLMVAGVLGVLRYQRARQKKLADPVFFLKTFGERISVPLDSCGIVHRTFDDPNNGSVEVCLVTFEKELKGEKVLFKSQPIYISSSELQEKLSRHKKAQLYYDAKQPAHHYFDLAFLGD